MSTDCLFSVHRKLPGPEAFMWFEGSCRKRSRGRGGRRHLAGFSRAPAARVQDSDAEQSLGAAEGQPCCCGAGPRFLKPQGRGGRST